MFGSMGQIIKLNCFSTLAAFKQQVGECFNLKPESLVKLKVRT